MPAWRWQDARMHLVRPSAEHLPSYRAALDRGWDWDADPTPGGMQALLARVDGDSETFLARMDDERAEGGPVTMPDGSTVPRLPGIRRWMWDGDFAGSISLRWQPGTTELPPTCLGHIGYGVVPWRQGRGYATKALGDILPEARARGLAFVDITTDLANVASQRVVRANGGVLVRQFTKLEVHGGGQALLWRIGL